MVSYTASFSPSHATSSGTALTIGMGVDTGRDPVFLQGTVRDSATFAAVMLALGEVVGLDERWVAKDNSAYQEWVAQEYIKELSDELRIAVEVLPSLLEKQSAAREKVMAASSHAQELRKALVAPRGAYYSWLYQNNRNLWMVLDPIVSVQPERTYFEAFSADESVYARVSLPHTGVDFSQPPQLGTTNIDFSLGLEREFLRARTYRALNLTVGLGAVEVATSETSVTEKKIDLPESWVRGLVEVQAALALASHECEIEAWRLADVLARLEAQKEKEGPRSLLFELTPDEPVSILIEPWNERVVVSTQPWNGREKQVIKVWGRRRLRVLTNLLTRADTVKVRLLGSGMPSFWSVEVGGMALTVGLSGWSSQDWANHARFSAFVPSEKCDITDLHQARYFLKQSHSLDANTLSSTLNVPPATARALLQTLTKQGVAMFDPETSQYLSRELFPNGQVAVESEAGKEESAGLSLAAVATYANYVDELSGTERTVSATIAHDGSSSSTLIRVDLDGRATFGQCSCNFFRYNKLKKGPCRHMVSLVARSA